MFVLVAEAGFWNCGPVSADFSGEGKRAVVGEGELVMSGKWTLQRADVSRPWKMYPLGVLFGLGFDTSSEVALLGIASIQGSKGTSIWLILIFPVLFTGPSSTLFRSMS